MSPNDAAEWKVRCDLAAAYRLIAHFGMDDLISTHLSARLPGSGHRFLLNPYGLMFDEITASSLLVVDPDGYVMEGQQASSLNIAGFTIHSAVHMARDNANCVMHTHSFAGMAVAAQRCGLLMLNQKSMTFHNRLAYHDYEGVATDWSERERLVRDLGSHNAMILKNHGLLTVGSTIAEAFLYMFALDQSCRLQIAALQGGQEVDVPPPHMSEYVARQVEEAQYMLDARPWDALKRRLDRVNPGYDT